MNDQVFEQAVVSWLTLRGYLVTKVDVVDVEVVKHEPFKEWYDLYPRKVITGAEKAYNSALVRGATHAELCDAVRKQKAPGCSIDPGTTQMKYIPHPSRWLNDNRWMEAPDSRTNKSFTKPQIGNRTRSVLDAFLESE